MKKIVLLAFALLGAFVIFDVARGFLNAAAHGGRDVSCERRLAAICKTMNAGLPGPASGNVLLDSVVAGSGRRMTYTYTFLNLSSAEIDPANLTAKMKPQLLDGYKTDPRMAEFRKMAVEVHFQYRGKDGNIAATIAISPKDL